MILEASSIPDGEVCTLPRMKTFGDRLRYCREAHGDSLRAAADAAGVSHETIASWERNAVKNVPDEPVRRLAKRYRRTFDWLKHGQEPGDIDEQSLEEAFYWLGLLESELGASVPLEKRHKVLRQLYQRAAAGTLDRSSAEDIIGLAL